MDVGDNHVVPGAARSIIGDGNHRNAGLALMSRPMASVTSEGQQKAGLAWTKREIPG